MEIKRVEEILKNLARRIVQTVPVKKVVAAICDDGVPYVVISPVPRNAPANFFKEVAQAFSGELIPSMIEKDDNLFIYFHPPQKVSKCKEITKKETNLPSDVVNEKYFGCIDAYKQITDKNFTGLVFITLEGCKACENLERFLYVEGAGAEDDEELDYLSQVLQNNAIFIDAKQCPGLAKWLGGAPYPRVVFIKNGQPVKSIYGFADNEQNRKRWKDFIAMLSLYLEESPK